jgi:fatty acid desaturase
MDRQAIFLLALGMLIAASLVVSVSGWVLFARDRALHRAAVAGAVTHDVHHGTAEEE